MTRQQIVTVARNYLGTPFHHQGRLKGKGIDCLGLIVCVCRDLGFDPIDATNYPWRTDSNLLQQNLGTQLVKVDEAEVGDVMLFWAYDRNIPTHLGFKTDKGLIHAYAHSGAKKVVEIGLDQWWLDRFVAAYQIPGVE